MFSESAVLLCSSLNAHMCGIHQLIHLIFVFSVALAEFQDHGLQSVDGDTQYGPGK